MKHLLARTCVFSLAVTASLLAVAQGLPRFGTARFGEAVFGQASSGADALPVPFMPLWATILLAVALWVVVYLMRTKEIEMIRLLTDYWLCSGYYSSLCASSGAEVLRSMARSFMLMS